MTTTHHHPGIPVERDGLPWCPACDAECGTWAEDGESDMADQWECAECGAYGTYPTFDGRTAADVWADLDDAARADYPSFDAFAADYANRDAPRTPRPECVRHPEVVVRLVGTDGNAFAVLGNVSRAMRQAGLPPAVVAAFMDEATAGNYDHLLRTCMAWVTVEMTDHAD